MIYKIETIYNITSVKILFL